MTAKTKRKIFSIAFLVLGAFVLVCTILLGVDFWSTVQDKNTSRIVKSEVVEMKVGETLAFTDLHPNFEERVQEAGAGYRFAYQAARSLASGTKVSGNHDFRDQVFVDENGQVQAQTVGVYQLDYAVVRVFSERYEHRKSFALIRQPETMIFSTTVVVYADEYEPFSADPAQFKPYGNYILTENLTLDAFRWKRFVKSFHGTIINPDGYTLTLEVTDKYLTDATENIEGGFLTWNEGIIDGLKIKYVSSEEHPFISDFYALTKSNNGYIKNCEVTGDVFVDGQEIGVYGNPDETKAPAVMLPKGGLLQGNTVDLKVYNDGDIYPYSFDSSLNQHELPTEVVGCKENTVSLDTYYYSNRIGARERDIARTGLGISSADEYIYGDEYGNRFIPAYLHLGNGAAKTVRIELQTTKLGPVYTYDLREDGPLEIPRVYWGEILGTYYRSDDPEIVFKSWTVNGKEKETLDGLTARKDMEIAACAEYAENGRDISSITVGTTGKTYYRVYEFYNANDTMVIEAETAEDGSEISLYESMFEDFFQNPYNKIPEKIIIEKGVRMSWRFDSLELPFCQDSLKALHSYFLDGGKLEIESGNLDCTFIQEKMLCTADGKALYAYFPKAGETEASLHPQIEELRWNSFLCGEELRMIDLSTAKRFDSRIFRNCKSLETVRFGEEITVRDWNSSNSYYPRTLPELLSQAGGLKSIVIDPNNVQYSAQNGFVIEERWIKVNAAGDLEKNSFLIYALPTFVGAITVPQEVTALENGCFQGSGIEELIFPDTLKYFNEGALRGMSALKTIRFGASPSISKIPLTGVVTEELPSLTSIDFSDATKELYFEKDNFKNAKLETVILPSNLETCRNMFTSCKKFVYKGAGTDIRTDTVGALYWGQSLVAYPKYAAATEYEVPDSRVTYISQYAFEGNKALKKVTFGGNLEIIGFRAFQNSAVEEIVFKGTGGRIFLDQESFEGCKNLTKATFDESVIIDLGNGVFKDCERLKEFPVAQAVSLSKYVFQNTALESVEINEGILSIPDSAFEGCKALKSVTGNLAVQIGTRAFADCISLTEISGAFVTSLGSEAFKNSGLERVNFPKLVNIPTSAFEGCKSLAEATFYEYITVGEAAFKDCVNLAKLNTKYAATVFNSGFENCAKLEEITVGEQGENKLYTSVGEKAFAGCTSLKSVNIYAGEEGTAYLHTRAFEGCVSLEGVYIKATNGTVETGAFTGVTKEMQMLIDGGEGWQIEGLLPSNITVFVHERLVEIFREKWIVDDKQILAMPDGAAGEE